MFDCRLEIYESSSLLDCFWILVCVVVQCRIGDVKLLTCCLLMKCDSAYSVFVKVHIFGILC